eukprot:1975011-Amphidinium_carterae.2
MDYAFLGERESEQEKSDGVSVDKGIGQQLLAKASQERNRLQMCPMPTRRTPRVRGTVPRKSGSSLRTGHKCSDGCCGMQLLVSFPCGPMLFQTTLRLTLGETYKSRAVVKEVVQISPQ